MDQITVVSLRHGKEVHQLVMMRDKLEWRTTEGILQSDKMSDLPASAGACWSEKEQSVRCRDLRNVFDIERLLQTHVTIVLGDLT